MTETMSEKLLPNEHDDQLASAKMERALANALISDLQERIAELEAACRDARSALESLPADSLGAAYRVECAPDGEGRVMTWPFRDELVDKISRALDPSKEATDETE